MKIYIFADMEGISGITGSSFVTKAETHYNEGRLYLTEEINACAKACFEAGVNEVIVRDGHGAGLSVLWEKIISGIHLIQGDTPHVRYFGLDGCDGVILLGYHAMAGTKNAHLEHSYNSHSIQNVWVNGQKAGEFAIDTLIAGEHGVPVIMTSGCDKLCSEASAFHPDVVTCQVKTSISQQGAMLLSPEDSHSRIREKTIEAIEKLKAGKIHPVTLAAPISFRVEYMERCEPQYGLTEDRTVEWISETVEDAFFKCFY